MKALPHHCAQQDVLQSELSSSLPSKNYLFELAPFPQKVPIFWFCALVNLEDIHNHG